jgi:TolA-binding protein
MKMSQVSGLLLSSGIVFALAQGCVTTRQQLNEERGESTTSTAKPASSVQSEDLNPKSEPKLVQSPPATAPATAPVPVPAGSYTLDEIRSEMARLGGKVEELEHEKKLREEQRLEEQKKLQEKIAELEKQLKEQPPAGPAIPEGKTPLQAGKDVYFNEQYDQAIPYLEKAVQIKDTGKEAEEANYLLGESYFRLKNYQKAIISYSKFPEKFTKSTYHPKALLRIAECFDGMSMKEDAKAFYQNVLDQFPKTAEGKIAKKRLAASSTQKTPTKASSKKL